MIWIAIMSHKNIPRSWNLLNSNINSSEGCDTYVASEALELKVQSRRRGGQRL